jgi:hypothetical protein
MLMLLDLKAACNEKRVQASSSHSYYKAPECRVRAAGWVHVNVLAW